jgi:hypothetical protein
MDALCRAKAKAKARANWRGRADGADTRVTTAQAAQTQGQKGGGLRAPLWRRHARRVVEVGRCHGTPTGDVKPVGSVPLPSFRCIATRRSDSRSGGHRALRIYTPRRNGNTITVRTNQPGNFGNRSFGFLDFHSLCAADPSYAAKERGGLPRPLQVSPVWGSQYLGATSPAADFLGFEGAFSPTAATISAFCFEVNCGQNCPSNLMTSENASSAAFRRNSVSCCCRFRSSSSSFAFADRTESKVGAFIESLTSILLVGINAAAKQS